MNHEARLRNTLEWVDRQLGRLDQFLEYDPPNGPSMQLVVDHMRMVVGTNLEETKDAD